MYSSLFLARFSCDNTAHDMGIIYALVLGPLPMIAMQNDSTPSTVRYGKVVLQHVPVDRTLRTRSYFTWYSVWQPFNYCPFWIERTR